MAHSLSPQMHNAALRHLSLPDWHYQLLPLPPELFDETVPRLHELGFAGINVTIPHKQRALRLATSATGAARAIGAANTLTFGPEGEIHAANTDAPGLIAALPAPPLGADALVLGAGGSARAAVWALREAGAARVRVWNRTVERAVALAGELGAEHAPEIGPADVLINCTSVGLGADQFKVLPVPADLLDTCAVVADLVYRPGGTALVREAESRGCAVVDGLEILVHQGALSFESWTGREAPLDVMRRAVQGDVDRTSSPPDGARRAP